MSRHLVLFSAFVFALSSVVWAEDKRGEKHSGVEEFKITADEQTLIDLTNEERKKAEQDELKPLKMNPQLMEVARKHAANMAAQDKLSHTLDDKNPVDRVKAAGYNSKYVGENISWNPATPKEAVAAWMDSEPHRKNILKKEYTEIGVAVVKNKKGEPYWVQVFGKQ